MIACDKFNEVTVMSGQSQRVRVTYLCSLVQLQLRQDESMSPCDIYV
jgi:hypothetical protein